MADTVTVEQIFNGKRRKVTHLTSVSDGTGENSVAKIDISTFTDSNGAAATYFTIDYIEYNVQGFTSVRLYWDHTTDDEIAILGAGTGCIDWVCNGGKTDPRTTGGTGDGQLTTAGAVAGATYDITIHWRPKS